MLLIVITWMWLARANEATLIDPRVLERPVTEDDPLINLKYLWRDGVRGPVFTLNGEYSGQNGVFLAPDDWSAARARNLDSAIWWTDPDLLAAIKTNAAAGTTIVIQNRNELGGFAVAPENDAALSLKPILPRLAARPFVVLNGYSNLYFLQHEMVHHLDHESGLSQEVIDRINDLFDDPALTQEQITRLVFYITEARAYHLQLIGLLLNRRPTEYFATAEDDERTKVSAVGGPEFRRYRFAQDIYMYNAGHVKRYRALPDWMRARVEHLLSIYIPNYPRDFVSTGEMNQARCEQNLLSDLRDGRSILHE